MFVFCIIVIYFINFFIKFLYFFQMFVIIKFFFFNYVVFEQKKIIDLLIVLSNEIQEEIWIYKIGFILYLIIGFFGGLVILSVLCIVGSLVVFYGSGVMLFVKIVEFFYGDVRENIV